MKLRRFAPAFAVLILSSATAAAGPAAFTAWNDKTVPVELFAQFPAIQSPRLSPDGQWIASKVRAGGVQVLAIVPVGAKDAKAEVIAHDGEPLGRDKLGERQISGWHWLDNDTLLISLRYRDNYQGDWFDNTRFAAYSRSRHHAQPLGWDGAFGPTRLLWQSTNGAPRVLIERINPANGYELARSPEVVDVDAVTGATRVVQKANPVVTHWTADEAGVVRFGQSFDRDTGKLRVLYRGDAASDYHTVINQTSERYGDVNLPDLVLRNGKAYSVSRADGFSALYAFDLSTMKRGAKVFGASGYDIDGPLLSPARDAVEGVTFTDTRARSVYFDPRLKAIETLLEDSFGKGDVQIESADNKRERIVFRVGSLGQLPAYYLFDTVSGGVDQVGWWSNDLQNARLNPVSVVHYPASDGKQIEAILTMPRHKAGEKKLAAVVLPHGGPWARDDADWDSYGWAQALAEAGYVVIQPNYRGSSGYGRDWEKASEKSWGYRMQDDLNDAVDWLGAQGMVDPKRVCMMGWSYGGYAAARAAQRDGAKYRCAIDGAGPVDLPREQSYDKDYLGRYGSKTGMGSAGTDLVDISPGLHAEQITIPILVVQGARDERVPVIQAREFVARLRKAGKSEGKDFEYLEQPLNTHNLLREADRVEFLKHAQAFLAKHNPA